MVEIISFERALELSQSPKHLLLGNGFSRACRNDVFSYDSLFERADFGALSPTARQAFVVLQTTDFEVVMRALRQSSALAQLYAADNPGLAVALQRDANGLREVLATAIAENHPEFPAEIPDTAYQACRLFLGNFKDIYTLNYDLLLYWTLMRVEMEPKIGHDDGFRTPEDGPEPYVTWEVQNTNDQNVHYLHGALHVFDSGANITKYTWANTGVRIIEQIRDALSSELFPFIVAEGNSDQKMAHINHNNYLSRSYRSFCNIAGCMFVFGHSMAANDEHIFTRRRL